MVAMLFMLSTSEADEEGDSPKNGNIMEPCEIGSKSHQHLFITLASSETNFTHVRGANYVRSV